MLYDTPEFSCNIADPHAVLLGAAGLATSVIVKLNPNPWGVEKRGLVTMMYTN